MKKLLLLPLLLLTTFAGIAQDDTSEVTETWTVTAEYLSPSEIETVEYTMTPTEVTKAINADANVENNVVYTATVDIKVFPEKYKESKVHFTITHTGKSTDETASIQLVRKIDEGDMKLTIAAWLYYDKNKGTTITTQYSNTLYVIGDTNWTALGILNPSSTGKPAKLYFNCNSQEFKNLFSLNGTYTDYNLAGKDQCSVHATNTTTKSCLNIATYDYASTTISFEKATSVDLYVENYLPFVVAADATLPKGLTAYVYSELQNGTLYLVPMEGNVVAANTPVVLKAAEPQNYTLTLGDVFYYTEDQNNLVKSRTLLLDSNNENEPFYGVHMPHYVPANGYIFSEGKFVKAPEKTIVQALDVYLKSDVEGLEEINIVFVDPVGPEDPVEPAECLYVHFTDANGNHASTHATTLPLNADGSYSAHISFGENSWFVLADATFEENSTEPEEPETPEIDEEDIDDPFGARVVASSKSWADLGEKATIFHAGEDGAVLATKASDATAVTPFQADADKTYNVIFTPATEDSENRSISIKEEILSGIEDVNVEAATATDNRTFNIFGQQVDDSYKGIVIRNGKKFIRR